MNNFYFRYMLGTDADKLVNKKTINRRKKIHKPLLKVMGLTNPLKLNVEKRNYIPNGEPVIYISSHNFKDDVLNTVLTVEEHCYLLFGNIKLFFGSYEGIPLWMNGLCLVDRFDSNSRKAAVEKMVRSIELGTSVIAFPEATWNLTDNLLSLKLFGGFYDVAKRTGAKVVPIGNIRIGNQCYMSMDYQYDPTKFDLDSISIMLKRLKVDIIKAKDLLVYDDDISKNIYCRLENFEIEIDKMIAEIDVNNFNFIADAIESKALELRGYVKEILVSLDEKTIDYSIFNRVSLHLYNISNMRKNMACEIARDKLSELRFEIIENHGEFVGAEYDRKKLTEEWILWKNKLISQTKYFDPDFELTAIYKDRLVDEPEDVLPHLVRKK